MNHIALRIVLIFICLLTASVPVFSQEPATEVPFLGKKLEVYELRPGLTITVTRDTAGHIKKYRIVPIDLTGEASSSRIGFDEALVKELIDELVPHERRGAKSRFYGLTFFSGGGGSTCYGYEHVSIHYIWISQSTQGQRFLSIEFLDHSEESSGDNQPDAASN